MLRNFGSAVMACLEKFMIFRGRASRAEFWWFFLAWLIASVIAAILELILRTNMISVGVQVAFVLPILAAGARRLHDTDRPGYYLAMPLLSVPFYLFGPQYWGMAFLFLEALLLLLLALPGQRGPNRYGPDPRDETDAAVFE